MWKRKTQLGINFGRLNTYKERVVTSFIEVSLITDMFSLFSVVATGEQSPFTRDGLHSCMRGESFSEIKLQIKPGGDVTDSFRRR